MNERIKRLMEQAEEWDTAGDNDKCEINIEKFAKLLILECADVADGGYADVLRHFDMDRRRGNK